MLCRFPLGPLFVIRGPRHLFVPKRAGSFTGVFHPENAGPPPLPVFGFQLGLPGPIVFKSRVRDSLGGFPIPPEPPRFSRWPQFWSGIPPPWSALCLAWKGINPLFASVGPLARLFLVPSGKCCVPRWSRDWAFSSRGRLR